MATSKDYTIIKVVLDKYFDFLKEGSEYAFSAITETIPELMLEKGKDEDESGYSFWLPIESTITNDEIVNFELSLGHKLPESFKYFLKQRHFMELHLDHHVNFFSILPGRLASEFNKIIDNYYWNLLNRNYIPFANYSDWGVVCFNANEQIADHDFEVVYFDHEDNYEKSFFLAGNFLKLMESLNIELDNSIMQIRAARQNSA